MVKVAVVQAGSVVYNTDATIAKLERFAEEAANKGAELVLFPGELASLSCACEV